MMEVLIVLVLIGLATALAVPRIDLDSYRMSAAVHQVGGEMLGAQRLAVKRQHNIVVAFDSAAHRLRTHQDGNNNGLMDAGERVTYTPLGDGVVFGAGGAPPAALLGSARVIAFNARQAGLPAVTFRRSGSASEEGGFLLTSRRAVAQGSWTHARGVRVERATGRITWYRYASSAWKRES